MRLWHAFKFRAPVFALTLTAPGATPTAKVPASIPTTAPQAPL